VVFHLIRPALEICSLLATMGEEVVDEEAFRVAIAIVRHEQHTI
jgi:hypothetical protein